MEFVSFNIVIFVEINLIECLLQSHSSLSQNFNQVIEYFVLSGSVFSFLSDIFYLLGKVTLVELVQLGELYYAVFVRVNFLEECSYLSCFQT